MYGHYVYMCRDSKQTKINFKNKATTLNSTTSNKTKKLVVWTGFFWKRKIYNSIIINRRQKSRENRDKESTPPEEGERGKKIRLTKIDERRKKRPERERREEEKYSKAVRKAAQGTPKVWGGGGIWWGGLIPFWVF